MKYSAFEAMSVSSLTHVTGVHYNTSPEYRKMNLFCPIWISSFLKLTFPADQRSTSISWSTKARSFYYHTSLSQAQLLHLENNHVVLPPAAPMNRVLQEFPTLTVRHLLLSSLNLFMTTLYSFAVFYHKSTSSVVEAHIACICLYVPLFCFHFGPTRNWCTVK